MSTDNPLTPARLAELRRKAIVVAKLAAVFPDRAGGNWRDHLGDNIANVREYVESLDPATVLALVAADERLREVAAIAEVFFRVSEFREVGPEEYIDASRRWLAIRDSVLPREGNADGR